MIRVHAIKERRDNVLFITLVPKVILKVFFFFGFTTLRFLVNFDWRFIKLSVQMFQTLILNYKGVICESSLGMYINLSAIVLSL